MLCDFIYLKLQERGGDDSIFRYEAMVIVTSKNHLFDIQSITGKQVDYVDVIRSSLVLINQLHHMEKAIYRAVTRVD